jgi:hypothetical protein
MVLIEQMAIVKLLEQAHELPDATWQLSVDTEACGDFSIGVDPRAPLAWRELEKLRELKQLSYQGQDVGLLRWLPRARRLRHLIWQDHHLSGVVDLRRTRLQQLGLVSARLSRSGCRAPSKS